MELSTIEKLPATFEQPVLSMRIMGISRNSHRHQTGGALGVGFRAGGHDIGSTPATVELLECSAVSGRPQDRGARKHRCLLQAGRVLLPSVSETESGGNRTARPSQKAELCTKAVLPYVQLLLIRFHS